MRTEELPYIGYRLNLTGPAWYEKLLKNYVSRDRPGTEFENLIAEVFKPKKADFQSSEPSKDNPPSIDYLFYDKYYKTPELTNGPSDGILDEEGNSYDFNEFIKFITMKNGYNSDNNLIYLIGEVGVGKTGFINYVLTIHLSKFVKNGSLFFIKIDVQQLAKRTIINKYELMGILSRKTLSVFRDMTYLFEDHELILDIFLEWQEYEDHCMNNNEGEVFRKRCEYFRQLIKKIKTIGNRKPLLIFDNIDYYVHSNDRGIYRENIQNEEAIIINELEDFISLFTAGQEFGELGASVVFVGRKDTFEILGTVDATSVSSPLDLDKVNSFSILKKSPKDVYEARKDLIGYYIEQLNQSRKQSDYREFLEKIEEFIKTDDSAGATFAEEIFSLCNHGYRELVPFLASLGWAEDVQILSRVANQKNVALLIYLLGRKCGYSQVRSLFPNIYLVNQEYRSNTNPSLYEHSHTYWLKRLILEFIRKMAPVRPQDIINVFSPEQGGYGDSIVRECLGSMTDANSSNLIKAHRARSQDKKTVTISNCTLTERGKTFLSEIIDTFNYLQLIVDDPWLPLPRSALRGGFKLDKSAPSYTYLVTEGKHYIAGAKAMIKFKAERVLEFIKILEISLELEQSKYSTVFDSLTKVYHLEIPSVHQLRSKINSEIQWLGNLWKITVSVDESNSGLKNLYTQFETELANVYSLPGA